MRPTERGRDAAVIGAGPNGLAAAIALAQRGLRVTVFEAKDTIGGGSRTAELTLPGFRHDVCSAVHPMAAGSPFFSSLPLEQHGLRWLQPDLPLAHPFDDGTAAVLHRSIDETAGGLGVDGASYRRLFGPLAGNWRKLSPYLLGPQLRLPRHPLLMARFGLSAIQPAAGLSRRSFRDPRTRALFVGIAAHANVDLGRPLTAGFGLVLGAAAHAAGWPFAAGGSQSIVDSLARLLESLGGEIRTGCKVESLDALDEAGVVMCDLTPRQLLDIAGGRLGSYGERLRRFRFGPGVFKLDYALDEPIPWRTAECRRAGTVHLGGTMEEILASEAAISRGDHPERPYVLVAQQSLFDPSRAPAGKHTAWVYCHVPHGSDEDMTERIEAQIERFAPGFRELVLARHRFTARELETYNENYIGGDIGAGAYDGLQLLLRPALRLSPYTTPDPRIFICSASTPPGGGVHGMCGYFAAMAALSRRRA